MKHEHKPRPADQIQLEQLARELETDEGRKRLGDEAYQEAMAAEKRKSIQQNPPKH
ncbi:MAG: hypothetical protein ACFB2Z_01750 [Maricaulaceae bacterium]